MALSHAEILEAQSFSDSSDGWDGWCGDGWWYLEGYRDVLIGNVDSYSSNPRFIEAYRMGRADAEGDLNDME